MRLTLSSSPHIRARLKTSVIYWLVILALLPATVGGVYFFGMHALYVILVSVASAIVIDNLFQRLTKNKLDVINGSAVITGLLLALIIPPTVPLWLPVIGNLVAIGLAKYAFGPGNAIFNPALAGRMFVAVSFPVAMAHYIGVDGVTSATPLTIAKEEGFGSLVADFGSLANLHTSLFNGTIAGSLGETSALLLLIGGLFLLVMQVIDWRIPVSYLGAVAVLALLFREDVLFHLFSGGLMIGAFFMATDYVTSPVTWKGRLIFGAGCGLLTMLLRMYSVYPEGVAFSILLMNATVPLIDRYTRPRVFGK